VVHSCIAIQIPIAARNQEARIRRPRKAARALNKLYIYSKLEIEYNIRPLKTLIRTRITFWKVPQAIALFRAKRHLNVTPLVAIKQAWKAVKVAFYEETLIKRDTRVILAILRATIPGLTDQTIAEKVCSRRKYLILDNKLKLLIVTRYKWLDRPPQRARMTSEIWTIEKNCNQPEWLKTKNKES